LARVGERLLARGELRVEILLLGAPRELLLGERLGVIGRERLLARVELGAVRLLALFEHALRLLLEREDLAPVRALGALERGRALRPLGGDGFIELLARLLRRLLLRVLVRRVGRLARRLRGREIGAERLLLGAGGVELRLQILLAALELEDPVD